ncbi:MAG TPA: hypothetical protein VGM87_17435 [Roseomonas sp.]|jgi:hypothetical protein
MATRQHIYDRHGGILRTLVWNPAETESRQGGAMHFVTRQDCDGILAANRRDTEADQRGRDFRLAARVPLTVIDRAMREGWMNDRAAWRRWLNDGANAGFRVWQGRV